MDSILGLKGNVEKLVQQIEKLKEQNAQLRARAVAAEARVERIEKQKEELEGQFTSLVLRSSITEVAGGTKAAKLRINRLIRDIDKCIALSSK